MHITLGFSPCPNDTFIFGALVNGLIDTEGLEFEVILADVEALNKMAVKSALSVTKLSYHAFAHLTHQYSLLHAGSALGNNCGPLLVARQKLSQPEVENAKIAIPGVLTTANFLLGLAYPGARDKTPVLFSEIEDSVLNGEYDAGLIIHENRFTYEQKGLIKIMDLGEFWEESTHTPIPLGGIVVRNDIDKDIQLKINRLIRKSVEYAYAHTNEIMPYIREHAQSMSDAVMMSHINLYVNQFSIDLGETGRNAVKNMFLMASSKQLVSGIKSDFFV